MAILKLKDRLTGPAAITATVLFLCASVLFFLPVDLAHKITIPVGILTIASLWLCPWQMTMAFLFSALGDYMGSCQNFLGQMGFFAVGHIWFIVYFIKRYFSKVERDRKLTGKAKGYLAIVIFCALALLSVAFFKIAPGAPAGIIRIGVCIYACLISTMMVMALLQRSSLFALGAILFVFSDFILAWNKFVEPVPYRDYLVLVTYFLAQWLLFIRSTRYRVAPEMRILRF
ncbi:MAG: lysoplasmalogenase [Bacteroidales bacterium]|nr:lysoplasmalogenase [Bacteroidales bacterium]